MSQHCNGHIVSNLTLRSASSFEERAAACAAAGFSFMGLGLDEYRAYRGDGWSPARMNEMLEKHGVRIVELEVHVGLPVDGVGSGATDFMATSTTEDERQLFEMADIFGARHMQAIGRFGSAHDPNGADGFAQICDRAADHGLLVALEFVPTSTVPDAGVALEVVERADRPNGGICVDTWHHARGANDDGLLRKLPAEKVFLIQVSDGPTTPQDPDYITDTLRNRRVPGQGEFDLPTFFATLADIGVHAPISLEVLSEDLDRHGAVARAAQLAGCLDPYDLP